MLQQQGEDITSNMKINKVISGKMKEPKYYVFFVAALLLTTSVNGGISLGSSSDVTSISLAPGAYGVFKTSFFNMGSEPLDVEFEVEYPADLRIEVDPPRLSMDNSLHTRPISGGTWLILDGGRRYVKTYPVSVYVKIPSTISRNRYTIKLIATARGNTDSSSQGFEQTLVQVREILFTVNVDGRVGAPPAEVIRVDASSGDVIKEEALQSFNQGDSYQPSSSGGANTENKPSSINSAGNQPTSKTSGGFSVSRDSSGGTSIDLPTGRVSLSQSQTQAAIDLGLVTLIISIVSLIVRILK